MSPRSKSSPISFDESIIYQFQVTSRPGLNKAQLADSLSRHFHSLPVTEKESITYFIYMIKVINIVYLICILKIITDSYTVNVIISLYLIYLIISITP